MSQRQSPRRSQTKWLPTNPVRFSGEGEVWIDGARNKVKADGGIVVPQGARHNVVSTGKEPLRLYTIYGPPEHIDGTIHKTSEEAKGAHEHFDGKTTE